MLAKRDPVPLDLLVHPNPVQQELTRLGIISIESARETGEQEENAKQPLSGQIFESNFDLMNQYSNKIIVTDSVAGNKL